MEEIAIFYPLIMVNSLKPCRMFAVKSAEVLR